MRSSIPVLLYHDIESAALKSEKQDAAGQETVVDCRVFEAQMCHMHEEGFMSVSLADYFQYRTMSEIPPKCFVVSFDDGHSSNYKLAFPVLKAYGFKGIFFVVAGWIDTPGYLTREQIRKMALAGMEIGSHGLTHAYLPLLEKDEIEVELKESKRRLETIIDGPVSYFAYPGGHYTTEIVRLVEKCGYRGACSCLQGTNSYGTNPFLLKRIEIRKNFTQGDFTKVFDVSQILLYQTVDLFKRGLRRMIGLESYVRIRSLLYGFYFFKR